MKKRIHNWLQSLVIRYIPGTTKLATMEAQRLAKYLTENYSPHQQLLIIDEMKHNIATYRKAEITAEEILIATSQNKLKSLETNLSKLIVE